MYTEGTTDRIRCPDPGHTDEHPSAVIYEEIVYCPVCSSSWDIFEVAGKLQNADKFTDKINKVLSVLGEAPSKNGHKIGAFDLPPDKAREIFTQEAILKFGEFAGFGDSVEGVWPYYTPAGDIKILDVRYRNSSKNGKKNVVTLYYNSKNIVSRNAPYWLYNLDVINEKKDAKVIIFEGAKTAKEADFLIEHGYIPTTWNGGSGRIMRAPWDMLDGRDVLFFPDDDSYGIKAAQQYNKKYGGQIIKPHPAAKKIKAKGADIVDLLQVLTEQEIIDYISNDENYFSVPLEEDDPVKLPKPPKSQDAVDSEGAVSLPFRILGIAEDDQAYFLDRNGRLYNFALDRIGRSRMLQLAPLDWWRQHSLSDKMTDYDWVQGADMIMNLAGSKDFYLDNLRGRGAWMELDGRTCFHDGKETIGEYGADRVFLRKPKLDIGLSSPDLPRKKIDDIKKACFSLSFESEFDCVKLLSWCLLAPFSGCLPWRPQAFLTGPSSSGKSSIENLIVKPLAIPARYNGGKTSAAGFIQDRRKDCGAVVIEESDPDTEKKKTYREDLLSIMRQSTSDDTPKSAMGTADQTGKSYTTKDMFIFLAISPDIQSVADDNRLIRINTTRPQKQEKWSVMRKELERVLTPENCRCIRAMTWRRMRDIKLLSVRISECIQDYTGEDHRFAISGGTLLAAYMTIFMDKDKASDEEIQEIVAFYYTPESMDEKRDESEEVINRILEYRVRISIDREIQEHNVLEILKILATQKIEDKYIPQDDMIIYKRSINNIGISLHDDNIAIANHHNDVKRIIQKYSGYARILHRHKDVIDRSAIVRFVDKQRRCTIIGGIVSDAITQF